MSKKPIGIFDSGIGGLTVAREIAKALPNESFIYLGDTARVPYGTRGKEIIAQFALELANFLLSKDVKMLVVACNTISATCLDKIQEISSVPVIGVIEPSAAKIAKTTKTKRVGIIGTRATINSRIYEKKLKKIDSDMQVFTQACPLLIPIAEEGLAGSEIAKLCAKNYLYPLKNKRIDTLHLGCTHYPILDEDIRRAIGKDVTIIDAAQPTAQEVKRLLTEKGLLSSDGKPKYEFYVTDSPEGIHKTAKIFFRKDIIANIRKVKLA